MRVRVRDATFTRFVTSTLHAVTITAVATTTDDAYVTICGRGAAATAAVANDATARIAAVISMAATSNTSATVASAADAAVRV